MTSPLSLPDRFRRAFARVIALAMVATVLGHAVAPVTAPLERVRGSAFSAATADVSVLVPLVGVKKLAIERLGTSFPALALFAAAPPVAAAALARPRVALPPARAPPDRRLRSVLQPQAPPAR